MNQLNHTYCSVRKNPTSFFNANKNVNIVSRNSLKKHWERKSGRHFVKLMIKSSQIDIKIIPI